MESEPISPLTQTEANVDSSSDLICAVRTLIDCGFTWAGRVGSMKLPVKPQDERSDSWGSERPCPQESLRSSWGLQSQQLYPRQIERLRDRRVRHLPLVNVDPLRQCGILVERRR